MALDEALRRASIGGSDIAAILNIDDYRDPYSLWVLKTGRAEAEPPTSRMLLGKAFERGILEFYANTTGRELRYLDITEQHPTRPWMVYTPDAVCVHEPRGVDAKLVSLDQRFRWGATSDEIPPRIQAQCWWYMAAMDFPLWDVAAVLTTGDPLFYTVERDMDLEAAMLEAAEEYWRRFLCGDEVPTPGATLATTNYLKRAYPQHFGAKPEPANETQIALLEQYAQVRIEAKAKDTEKRAYENQIKSIIGETVGLEWERGVFTWKTTKASRRVDYVGLAQSLLKNYGAEERAALESEFTETRPGVRRVHFRYAGAEDDE